jgi:hypothetical protein
MCGAEADPLADRFDATHYEAAFLQSLLPLAKDGFPALSVMAMEFPIERTSDDR